MRAPADASLCPTCGGVLDDGAIQGLCRACLLRTTLGFGGAVSGSTDLRALFAELEAEPGGPGAGVRVEGFEILSEIARGGMGVVFKARQLRLNRVVALKMIRRGPLALAEDLARFRREAEVVAQLQHPHIVAIYAVGEHDGEPWFAMEFVDGPSLADAARKQPLAPARAVGLLLPVCAAIQHAHERGVLHRDLKPSNILLDATDRPYVTDFGLARSTTLDSSLTGSAGILGSPSYMAPEQASGQSRQADARADVYSLGAVLYELLTGRPPFQAESPVQTLKLVLDTEPVAPRRLNPAFSPDLETICLKCLAKEPGRRYPTVRDLAADLTAYLEHRPIQARPMAAAERAARWCRRNPVLAALALSLGLAVVLGLGGVLWQWRRAEQNASRELHQRSLAEHSERQRTEQLYDSLLAQAHAQALDLAAGSRATSLAALRQAVALRGPSVALRSEAITALAKTDFRPDQQWRENLLGTPEAAATFNAAVSQWATVVADPQATNRGWLSVGAGGPDASGRWTRPVARTPGLALGPFSADGRWLLLHDAGWRLLRADTGEEHRHWTGEFSVEERFRGFTGDLTEAAFLKIGSPTLVRFGLTNAGSAPRGETHLRADPACVVFRPGTREAYYTSYALNPPDQLAVQVVNLDSGRETQLPLPAQPTLLCWSPDGRWLAAHAEDLLVHLWDFSATPQEVGVLGPSPGWRTAAAFSPDARIFASCGTEGVISVWEVPSRQLLALRDGAYGSSLRLQPPWLGLNNRVEGALERHRLTVDDVCRVLAEPTSVLAPGPSDVVFTADSALMVAAAPDGLRVWDWRAGRPVGFLATDRAWDVHREPDGLLLRGPGFYERYEFMDAPAGVTLRRRGRFPAPYHTVWCVPSGYRLIEATEGGPLEFIPEEGPVRRLDPPDTLLAVKANPGGRRLLGRAAAGLMLWDLPSETLIRHWSTDPLTAATWSTRGEAFFTAGWKSTCAWDGDTGALLWRNPECPTRTEECVITVSPDERWLALTTGTSEVTLLARATGELLARFVHPRPQPAISVAFSADSRLLAVLNINHLTHLWDLGRLRPQLAGLGLDWPGPPITAGDPPPVRPVTILPAR